MIDGEGDRLVLTQDGNQRIRNEWSFRQRDALGRESLTGALGDLPSGWLQTAVLDAQGDTLNVMRYNRLNLPEEYVTASGDRVRYVYSADGEKLYVQLTTAANVTTGTEYAVNYWIENGLVTMIHTDAGYYTPSMTYSPGGGGQSWQHLWYLQDHLGNNRVLADDGGNAIALHDYDPYGGEISVAFSSLLYPFPPGGRESPYKYGGKEWTSTTSTYDFEARRRCPGR